MNIVTSSVFMRLKPFENSTLETECLFGETVEILESYSNWLYCKLLTDGYCGWIKKCSLGILKPVTHRVISLRTFLYSKKNFKENTLIYLPMGSKIPIKKKNAKWAEVYLSENQKYQTAYVPTKDLVEIDNKVIDWVSIAEKLIGTPYRWGGRDTIGIDCSALIQLSYEAYGKKIPRNSIDQMNLKKQVIKDITDLERGCVVFWKGHVGLMTDKVNLLHANAFHMKTIVEPLKKVILRMVKDEHILKIMDFN
jgi:hypothetical protein